MRQTNKQRVSAKKPVKVHQRPVHTARKVQPTKRIATAKTFKKTSALKNKYAAVIPVAEAPVWMPGDNNAKVGIPKIQPYTDVDTIIDAREAHMRSLDMPIAHSPFGGFGKLIKEHGSLKFGAFLAVALLSKEVIQVDAGMINFFNSSFVLFSYYIALQGGIKADFRDFQRDIHSRYQDALKTKEEILKAGIRHCTSVLDKPAVIEDINKAFQEAHEVVEEARTKVAAQKHRDDIIAKLQNVYNVEQAEARAKAEETRNAALQYLRDNVYSDKVKEAVMTEALSLVGKKADLAPTAFGAVQTVLKQALKQ